MKTTPTKNIWEYLSIGQLVEFGNKETRNLRGEITAITIRADCARYEVTWWKNDERKTEWFPESEIVVVDKPKIIKIGFSDI